MEVRKRSIINVGQLLFKDSIFEIDKETVEILYFTLGKKIDVCTY